MFPPRRGRHLREDMSALWPDMPPNATFFGMHPSQAGLVSLSVVRWRAHDILGGIDLWFG